MLRRGLTVRLRRAETRAREAHLANLKELPRLPMTDTLTDVARRTASNSMRLFKEAVTRIARAARAAALEMGREIGQPPAQTPAPAQITPAAPAPAPPAPSVVSAKAEIIGSITTTEELHVHGTVNGDISAARIIVGAGGAVKGG